MTESCLPREADTLVSEQSCDDSAAATPFLKLYAGTTAGILLGIVTINAVVDPLWVYHRPLLRQSLIKDQRQGNPGIARFSTYDSVVIGNSLTENLRVTEIESHLGWRPVKLCISGSTPREQRLILEQGLATGQVRDVLWSLDMFCMAFGPDEFRCDNFPHHLYDRGLSTLGKYLLSGSTLINSIKVVSGAGPKDLEARHVWKPNTKCGQEPVLAKWRHTFTKPDFPLSDRDLAWQSAEKHHFEVIRSHPEIRFHFIFPPYSAMYRVSELVGPDNQFATRMAFKRDLARRLLEFPNVELFDFETAFELTHDMNRYSDLIHYDQATSTSILAWMAAGKYRLTTDTIDDQIHQLENDTWDYAKAIFSSDNPFRDQLRIEEFGLRLPTSMASVIPESISDSPQVADGGRASQN